MQDEEIVGLYFKRDESAISETQKKYEKYLTKIAYNVLSDLGDSEESVNDTYLAAWNSIPPNRPNVLSTYLGKIVRRISIDIFRKRHRDKRIASEYAISLTELEETFPSLEPGQPFEPGTESLTSAINAFLRTLSQESRNLFIGRYYFFDPLKEVARYCDMSESKAKTMLFRIRNSLKEYLIKEGFDV